MKRSSAHKRKSIEDGRIEEPENAKNGKKGKKLKSQPGKDRQVKGQSISKHYFSPGYLARFFAWLEDSENLGKVQGLLVVNTLLISAIWYGFQWVYGTDPYAYVPFVGSALGSGSESAGER